MKTQHIDPTVQPDLTHCAGPNKCVGRVCDNTKQDCQQCMREAYAAIDVSLQQQESTHE